MAQPDDLGVVLFLIVAGFAGLAALGMLGALTAPLSSPVHRSASYTNYTSPDASRETLWRIEQRLARVEEQLQRWAARPPERASLLAPSPTDAPPPPALHAAPPPALETQDASTTALARRAQQPTFTYATPELTAPARPERNWSRSGYHDPFAAPVAVRIPAAVLRRAGVELRAHLDGSDRRDETAWVPVGRYTGDRVHVVGLIPKGPRARCSPGDVEIDHAFVAAALLLLRSRAGAALVVTGLFHSHSPWFTYNSPQDQRTDRDHCRTLDGPGIYPIFVEVPRDGVEVRRTEDRDGNGDGGGNPNGVRPGNGSRPGSDGRPAYGHHDGGGARHGHLGPPRDYVVHLADLGVQGTFFAMDGRRPGMYVPCKLELDGDAPDASAWLLDHQAALEGCAPTAFDLAREGDLELSLVPGEGGAVVLQASLGRCEAVCLFAPGPGPVWVRCGERSAQVEGTPAASPDELARSIGNALRGVARHDVPAGAPAFEPRRRDEPVAGL